jgi:hypothetical protein
VITCSPSAWLSAPISQASNGSAKTSGVGTALTKARLAPRVSVMRTWLAKRGVAMTMVCQPPPGTPLVTDLRRRSGEPTAIRPGFVAVTPVLA